MTERRHPGGLDILGPLGRGGTAEVIRVYDPASNRECALKQPLKSAPVSEQLFRRLAEREFQLIHTLAYPGIVRCFRAELDSDAPYLLIELCGGKTLYDTGTDGELPFKLNVLCSVAVTLELVRARGLVHGDIKPHNIFLPVETAVCATDRLFYTKVTDFSMGKRWDEEESERAGRGTVGYMAPETIDGTATTHRSDLFSYGVLAYWFLTGVHPFLGEEDDPLKINSRVQEDDPPPLHEVNPALPESLDGVIRPLLAKKAEERTATAWEVAVALREAGATYPIERALQPKHCITGFRGNDGRPHLLEVNDRQLSRLRQICHTDVDLRLVLTANHVRGNLTYASDGWHWTGRDVYWPSRMRRRDLSQFERATLQAKRQIIRGGIVGTTETAKELPVLDQSTIDVVPKSVLSLIRPLLSQSTVRRESAVMAVEAEERNLLVAASRLYMQAGMLEQAVTTALAACDSDAAGSAELMGTIDLIIDLATMRDELFVARELILKKADHLKRTGQSNDALDCYSQIIGLYEEREVDKFLASVYKALGDLHKARHDVAKGIAALNTAMEIYQQLNAELDISHTLNNLGNIYWLAADMDSALVSYRKALRIQRRLNAKKEIASTLTNIGTVNAIGGRLNRAVNLYELSLQLKREIGDEPELARSLNNLGYVRHLMGQNDAAVEALQQSLEINKRHGTQREVLINLDNLTSFSTAGGQLDLSLELIASGLELAGQLEDVPYLATFKRHEATALTRLGRYDEAVAAIQECARKREQVSDTDLELMVGLTRATLRLSIGDTEEAIRIGEETAQKCRQYNNASILLWTLQLLNEVSLDDARFEEALKLAETTGSSRDVSLVYWNRIGCLVATNRTIDARELMTTHLESLDGLKQDIDYTRVCSIAGEALIMDNRCSQARGYLESGLEVAEQRHLLPEMIVGLSLLGRVALADTEYEEAYRHYRRALSVCKEIAGYISDEYDRKLFQNRRIVQFLVGEIKRLQALFAQKNRQVGSPA